MNWNPLARSLASLILGVFCLGIAWGQETLFDVSPSVNWIRGEIHTQASYDIAQAGIRLPTGRFLAEETLQEAYPGLIKPHLLSIKADSNSTIGNLISRGELSLEELDTFCLEAEKIPPSLSADLTCITGTYTIFIEKISSLLMRHRRAIEPEKPLIPVQSPDYSGIIIIADSELPVHGRKAQVLLEPCIFPKIWDTNMNLIYERNMLQSGLMLRYVTRESILRPTPSGLEGELAALVGPNPLRILAREVFGVSPTDPVIDRDDALKIISTENNRRLLREGRVIMVLNETQLIHNN
jgi:hypothetical protein